jgi:hypothetical protein
MWLVNKAHGNLFLLIENKQTFCYFKQIFHLFGIEKGEKLNEENT